MIKKFNEFINEDFTDLYKRWKNKDLRKEDRDNTHYIDLGLPSGTLWGDRNLGADTPEDCGDYYAWGETETKEEYTWDTYKYGSSDNNLTKYNEKDGKIVLDPEDDIVYLKTKGKAHMPTKEQIQELLDNTTYENKTINRVKGKLYTSKVNGNTIFMPFSGFLDDSDFTTIGSWFRCWSSSLTLYDRSWSCYLNSNSYHSNLGDIFRYCGFSVRGVMDKE